MSTTKAIPTTLEIMAASLSWRSGQAVHPTAPPQDAGFGALGANWCLVATGCQTDAPGLPDLVEGVRQPQGSFGASGRDVDEPDVSLTFIVFDTPDQARHSRAAVLANAPAQARSGVERSSLRVVEIRADAQV